MERVFSVLQIAGRWTGFIRGHDISPIGLLSSVGVSWRRPGACASWPVSVEIVFLVCKVLDRILLKVVLKQLHQRIQYNH